jgi:hypothetical protein
MGPLPTGSRNLSPDSWLACRSPRFPTFLVNGRDGTARFGDTRWQQLAEACGRQRKLVFHFDVQGWVPKLGVWRAERPVLRLVVPRLVDGPAVSSDFLLASSGARYSTWSSLPPQGNSIAATRSP